MKILMIAAEFEPLAKAGGLADMVAGLAGELTRRGHDVRVVLPAYPGIRSRDLPLVRVGDLEISPVRWQGTHPAYGILAVTQAGPGPRVYLIDAPQVYGGPGIYGSGNEEALRFALLAHAALRCCELLDWRPDVVHCHDWHAAVATVLLRGPRGAQGGWQACSSVLTIHNIGYQGTFPAALLPDLGLDSHRHLWPAADLTTGTLNFLRAGISLADGLTTVSPTHAAEILTPAYGRGLDALLRQRSHRLVGILNGIDDRRWDPATDPALPATYSRDDLGGRERCRTELRSRLGLNGTPSLPLIGMVSRLVEQKGVHLVLAVLPERLAAGQVQAAILGEGDPAHQQALLRLAADYPGGFAFLDRQDEGLARLIFAGSDLFLVPSLYEPCGLTQLYALRYGAVPVVRATGGLRDTISHFDPGSGTGTGSVFEDADPAGLAWGLDQALTWFRDPLAWQQVQGNGMAQDYSWRHQAPLYEALYAKLAA